MITQLVYNPKRKPITIHVPLSSEKRKKLLLKVKKPGCPKCSSPRIYAETYTVDNKVKRIWWCESCGFTWKRKKPKGYEEPKETYQKDVTKIILGNEYKEYSFVGPIIKGLDISEIKVYSDSESNLNKFKSLMVKLHGIKRSERISPVIEKRKLAFRG